MLCYFLCRKFYFDLSSIQYKKRMLMTIFGVCGSVTLIFAGFSVQHSISGIKARKFGEIIKYDLIVAQNEGINEKQQNEITN